MPPVKIVDHPESSPVHVGCVMRALLWFGVGVIALFVGAPAAVAGNKKRAKPRSQAAAVVRASPAKRLEIELVVMSRERRNANLHILALSSRGFVRRSLVHVSRSGLMANLGGGDHSTIPQEGARWDAEVEMASWLAARPGASDFAMAGALDLRGHSSFRGAMCNECVIVKSRTTVILARGIPQDEVEAILEEIETAKLERGVAMLDAAANMRQHWPGRAVIRSASYGLRTKDERGDETLTVDIHGGGRANEQLRRLHHWHLGEVTGPVALQYARDELALGRAGAYDAAQSAVQSMRAAISAYGSIPLWHARYALALALVNANDDRSVVALDHALSLAPRAREIRMIAAEVLLLRGEREAARMHLAALLGASPSDRAVLEALAGIE